MNSNNKLATLQKHSIQAPTAASNMSVKSLQDCARLLQTIGQEQAVLKLKDLQSFWLSIMADRTASHKDRLQASKLYAQSIGAFDNSKQSKGVNGANIRWRSTPIDAEVIADDTLGD